MLPIDDAVRAALEQNHVAGWRASAFYGAELTVLDVPLDRTGSLKYSGDAQIQANGTVSLAWDAQNLVPKSRTDALAPYGQELLIERTVTVGTQTWGIPMGRFRITEVPSAKEYFRLFPSQDPSNPANARQLVVGWAVQLKLEDRFERIIADDFLQTEGPRAGNTVWQEIQRLSPYPIQTSLPDATIPAGVAYESRIDAIQKLMAALGGVPHLTRQGVLTARPADAWLTATEPVFTVRGTIDVDDSWSMDLYNQVQVKSSGGSNELVAFRAITDPSNPLAVSRPIGGRTYRFASPLLDTQAKVEAAAETVLARVSGRQSKVVKVTCLPRPDIELGDYGVVIDEVGRREVWGEVVRMNFSMDATAPMTMELIAAETR